MKTILIWVIRHLLIPVGFVWTTGFFVIFEQNDKPRNPFIDGVGEFTAAEIATLEITPTNAVAYGDSLVTLRKEGILKTRLYTPYDYFHDMKQFEMFNQVYFDSLSETVEGSAFLQRIASFGGFSFRNQLVTLGAENWRNLYFCHPGSGLNNVKINLDDAIEKARLYWYPEKIHSPENTHTGNFWDDLLGVILNWLLNIYLKGLLLAALLFYIWRTHLNKEICYEFGAIDPRPELDGSFGVISFIASVLIWPIILGIDIKKRFSENFRHAEVLTYRANVFTLFSKTELKILETGKQMSFREFREHLKSLGMVRRHSFGFALVIVLILSFIPKPVHAKSISLCLNLYEKVVVTDYNYGDVDIGTAHFQLIENEPVTIITVVVEIIIYHFKRYTDEILSGFYPDIGVIPKLIYQKNMIF
jgi:hypothetical protein